MKAIKVLVVEDEVLIAETIKLYLEERGYVVVGIAISYDEAIEKINQHRPEIILLDIRLSGEKSGLDVANYLFNAEYNIPFIIVSSQYNVDHIERAIRAEAAGYITKPIVKETLWLTIEAIFEK